MKRNLILGIGLITFIFALSGLFIYSKLYLISINQIITQTHDEVRDMYSDIEKEMAKVQLELHERRVGHSKGNVHLIESVRKSEDMLSIIRNTYRVHKHEAICNTCHAITPKFGALEKEIDIHFPGLKEKVNLLAANNGASTFAIEKEAEKDVTEIMNAINRWSLEARAIHKAMRVDRKKANANARYLIVITIVLSLVLSFIIISVTLRSFTIPIKRLAEGIKKTSSGDYNSKVAVVKDDEIGVLTRDFNAMTAKLHEATLQKEALMKELRENNRNLEKCVHEVTEELKAAHENMRRIDALALVGTIASNLAHQLSTPLATLMGYCQFIESKVPEEFGLATYFNLMDKEIASCKNILTGTLDFVRIPEKEKSLTDINAMITELLLLICFQATCTNVVVKDDMDSRIPHIMANPSGLRQVFMNVIVNALEAMPDGGELGISTSIAEAGKTVVVSISDTGHGITESDLGKIFKSFYTTKKSGTGLGLSISYGIVKSHGGRITVRSEYGKGATFDIFLPVSVN